MLLANRFNSLVRPRFAGLGQQTCGVETLSNMMIGLSGSQFPDPLEDRFSGDIPLALVGGQ